MGHDQERHRPRNREQAAGGERQAELAVERGEQVHDDTRLARAQQRAAASSQAAPAVGHLAVQHAYADQQQATGALGQSAARAAAHQRGRQQGQQQ